MNKMFFEFFSVYDVMICVRNCVRTHEHFVKELAMDVILDELRKGGVNIDMNMLTYYINDLRERHGSLYDQIAVNVNSGEFRNVLELMNVTNFGRAMAYLVFVDTVDAPEELKREAVRFVTEPLRGFNVNWRGMVSWYMETYIWLR